MRPQRPNASPSRYGSSPSAAASLLFSSASYPFPTASIQPQFTFVNQSEDLQALAAKRLNNEEQRHQIRSHVMRGVRQHELAQGKKRPSGRDSQKPPSRLARTESADSKSKSRPTFVLARPNPARPQTLSSSQSSSPMYLCLGTNSFDPFQTAPKSRLTGASIDALLEYSYSHFMPMTFPLESKQEDQKTFRWNFLVRSKIHRPATFFSFLATIAAHRAVVFGRHKRISPSLGDHNNFITDPDYRGARYEAILAIQAKVDRREVTDGEYLEACFGFISTAIIVGNFEEAFAHLRGIQGCVDKIEVSPVAATWLPLVDIKAAVALLSKPLVLLPWPRAPVPQDIHGKLMSAIGRPMLRLGRAFSMIRNISPQLRELLPTAILICYFCEFNVTNSTGLTEAEQIIFRHKAQELEHDLLSYVYDIFYNEDEQPGTLIIPPLENVLRLAILGILSTVAAYILPACGLGRAITHHQNCTIKSWQRTKTSEASVAELELVTWALFTFIRSAEDQPEAYGFEKLLAETAGHIGLRSWDEVERIMYGYLYIPHVLKSGWMRVWDDVQRFDAD